MTTFGRCLATWETGNSAYFVCGLEPQEHVDGWHEQSGDDQGWHNGLLGDSPGPVVEHVCALARPTGGVMTLCRSWQLDPSPGPRRQVRCNLTGPHDAHQGISWRTGRTWRWQYGPNFTGQLELIDPSDSNGCSDA